MLKLLTLWMDLSEAALGAGAALADIATLPCLRPLTRMGEEIGDDQLAHFATLQSRLEQDFDALKAGLPGAAHAPAAAG